MNKKQTLILFAVLPLILILSPLVQAQDAESEELSFRDTVRELNQQIKSKRPYQNSPSQMGEARIHAGFSLLNSVNSITVNGKDRTRFEDGIGLSIGADLLNQNWMGEALLRNFGRSKNDQGEMSLREFDIRLNYIQKNTPHFGYRIINGLGARYMKWVDQQENINMSHATPHYILGFAMDIYANKNFSFGVEVDGRTSLIGETIDKHALDMTLKIDAYL